MKFFMLTPAWLKMSFLITCGSYKSTNNEKVLPEKAKQKYVFCPDLHHYSFHITILRVQKEVTCTLANNIEQLPKSFISIKSRHFSPFFLSSDQFIISNWSLAAP